MKRQLLISAILIFCLKSFCQTDGLIALNNDINRVENMIVSSSSSRDPNSTAAWMHIKNALRFAESSDMDKAIKEYNVAIQLDNEIAEAYDYRAQCYIKLKKYHKALNDLEEALEINSNYFEAYNHLGIVNYWLDNYEDAINCYTRAISLNPSYATPYFNRAIVYLFLGEKKLALKDLQQAKDLKLDGVEPVLQKFFADKK
jgi:tetratricopeptide (TPR) repeat protein